jgi:hypothetical protein
MSSATSKLLAIAALSAMTYVAAAQAPATQGPAPQPSPQQSAVHQEVAGARAAAAARWAATRPAAGTFSAFSYDAVGATPVLNARAARQGLATAEPTRAAPSGGEAALLATGTEAPRR